MPILFISFLLFWIILNGKVTVEIIIFGMLVSTLVAIFSYRIMGLNLKKEKQISKILLSIIIYLFILIFEVIKANIYMIKLVLSPNIQIWPQLIYFKSNLRSKKCKVALANSVTLTPGTITVFLSGDEFLIHAIDAPVLIGFEESILIKRLKKLEEQWYGI